MVAYESKKNKLYVNTSLIYTTIWMYIYRERHKHKDCSHFGNILNYIQIYSKILWYTFENNAKLKLNL